MDSGPTTNPGLIRQIQGLTDEAGWKEFDELYRPKIIAWCRRLGLQQADAEDVASQVFLKLYQNISKFDYDKNHGFRAWLYQVTKNTLIDNGRYLKRHPVVGTGDSHARELLVQVEDPNSAWDPTGELADEMLRGLVCKAEERVRPRVEPRTWAAYEARGNGQDAVQVGKALRMKVAAVHKARSRVLGMIREEAQGLLPPGYRIVR